MSASYFAITKHYDKTERDFDKAFKSALHNWCLAYHDDILKKEYDANSEFIEWNCLACRKPIKVNAKKFMQNQFDTKSIFCEEHQPKKYSRTYKRNFTFIKAMQSLSNKIKLTIITNSKSNL